MVSSDADTCANLARAQLENERAFEADSGHARRQSRDQSSQIKRLVERLFISASQTAR